MATFLQTVILGIEAGALDALLALGIVLIYRTTGVLNFAQASIGSFAAFVMFAIAPGHALWMAVVAGILVGGALGAGSWAVVSGVKGRNIALTTAVATLAIAILIQQAIRIIWGTTAAGFPTPFGFSAVTIGTITIAYQAIAAVIVAAILAAGIGAWLRWTRTGTMIRASADSRIAAGLCGARVSWLLGAVWALSGALAAVAGFFAAQIVFFPSFLDPYFVAALVAAVLGGLRSLTGAFIAAIGLEVAYTLFQTYAPSAATPYTQTFLLVLLIAILVAVPQRWLAVRGQRVV